MRWSRSPPLTTEAPSWVEVSARRGSDGRLLIHLVNGNPGRDLSRLHTDDLWVDEIPRVGPYRLTCRCEERPRKVTIEPGGKELDTIWTEDRLELEVPRFHIHTCVSVSPQK